MTYKTKQKYIDVADKFMYKDLSSRLIISRKNS